MTYRALVEDFSRIEDLPVPVDAVLDWIRAHTDHEDIRVHPVKRHKKAFRGAFRRIGLPKGGMYNPDYDIITQLLYGEDLPSEWKRLVIVKEALHVFDPAGSRITTQEGVKKLIPSVITPTLLSAGFAPAVDDYLGAYKAMAVLLPRKARTKLKAALDAGKRTTTEIAEYASLPDYFVGIWLDHGAELEPQLIK